MASALATRVHKYLVSTGRTWKIGGKQLTPTVEEVEQTLDKMERTMYTEKMNTISVGGLLMMQRDDHTDIYIHLGEIDD